MLNTAIHNRSRTQNTEVLILDATLKNKYIVFAETEDEDKSFWRDIINQFAPEKVRNKCNITVLFNSKGNKQNGVYEIRKFLKTTRLTLAEQNVLFCIDNVSCVVNCTAPFRVQGHCKIAIKSLNYSHFKGF